MRAIFLAAVVLVLVCYCERGHSLYFHISETELKCFIEEVPAETMIVGELRSRELFLSSTIFCAGKYKTQLYESSRSEWLPSSPGIGMHVEVQQNHTHNLKSDVLHSP